MSKNKDAKRKAKKLAQKAQAIQQSQARNDRVAEAVMDICSVLEEQYIDPEKTPDVTGYLVLWRMGRIAWNLALRGRRDVSRTELDATDLDAENKELLAENISKLIRRKYEMYPQIRIKIEKISIVLDWGKPRLKVTLGETYKEIPIPKYDDEPKPLTPEDILAIRKKAGLSQVKFAAALGVSVKKVSAWEHGKATPDEAEAEKIRRTGEIPNAIGSLGYVFPA
jgi:DNA-binding XRE family transcriptional regulator